MGTHNTVDSDRRLFDIVETLKQRGATSSRTTSSATGRASGFSTSDEPPERTAPGGSSRTWFAGRPVNSR
jgi:hypothetical protein